MRPFTALGAPHGGAGSANHLDAFHIIEGQQLFVPENAREDGRWSNKLLVLIDGRTTCERRWAFLETEVTVVLARSVRLRSCRFGSLLSARTTDCRLSQARAEQRN